MDQFQYIVLVKKDQDLLHFSIVYLILFTFSYITIFNFDYIKVWYLFLWVLMIVNLPSLSFILLLLGFERLRCKTFPVNRYIIASTIIFSATFYLFQIFSYDPRNFWPIFKEPWYFFLVISFCCHIITFLYLLLINKIIKQVKSG